MYSNTQQGRRNRCSKEQGDFQVKSSHVGFCHTGLGVRLAQLSVGRQQGVAECAGGDMDAPVSFSYIAGEWRAHGMSERVVVRSAGGFTDAVVVVRNSDDLFVCSHNPL